MATKSLKRAKQEKSPESELPPLTVELARLEAEITSLTSYLSRLGDFSADSPNVRKLAAIVAGMIAIAKRLL